MALSPFDHLLGIEQGRIEPQGVVPADGDFVFCLGADDQEIEFDLNAGDFVQVAQTADFDTTKIVKATIRTRAPLPALPAGLDWKLSLLIDGVERMSQLILADDDLTRDRVIAANVSQLAGDHELAYRLTLRREYPQTQAQFQEAIIGKNIPGSVGLASSAWHFVGKTGDEPDLIGSNDLSPQNSPTRRVFDKDLDSFAVRFAEGSAEAMQAASSTPFEVDGFTSFGLLMSVKMPAANDAALHQFFSKLTGGIGYVGRVTTAGFVEMNIDDGGTSQTEQIGSDHDDDAVHDLFFLVDRDTTGFQIASDLAASAGQAVAAGDLSNGASFAFGNGFLAAKECTLAYAAILEGITVETLVPATVVANFRKYMGR